MNHITGFNAAPNTFNVNVQDAMPHSSMRIQGSFSLQQAPVATTIPVKSPVTSMNVELFKVTVILANDQKTQGAK